MKVIAGPGRKQNKAIVLECLRHIVEKLEKNGVVDNFEMNSQRDVIEKDNPECLQWVEYEPGDTHYQINLTITVPK
jgi:hypothetical protein